VLHFHITRNKSAVIFVTNNKHHLVCKMYENRTSGGVRRTAATASTAYISALNAPYWGDAYGERDQILL